MVTCTIAMIRYYPPECEIVEQATQGQVGVGCTCRSASTHMYVCMYILFVAGLS